MAMPSVVVTPGILSHRALATGMLVYAAMVSPGYVVRRGRPAFPAAVTAPARA